ncbi:LOW QUALITY PROTEIN: hypothetical protein T265_15443 [Opisthorchis viverrini]|uniref:Uncharacterized protein n=1 Tax=Opisthorchis viverrini TaxID=6198 RepID=A0A074YYV8_OPIVI|nr:LOW QUALITY PROTEIN: hypothetical protein T265_15443 [Opisthorchis viverrini]KER19853.1 LOW QUALITY PROTEIN: hypothetical protein T265_15443 [Opisthorchis viverrini]
MGDVNCDNMLILITVAQETNLKEREVAIPALMQVCSDVEFIMPNQTQEGVLLVLTKLLGTQVTLNNRQWILDGHIFWTSNLCNKCGASSESVSCCHYVYGSLNRTAARLMHKYGAHGCTDVIEPLRHPDNLARFQTNPTSGFKLHSLPVLAHMVEASCLLNVQTDCGIVPKILGSFVVLRAAAATQYCKELKELKCRPAWVVQSDTKKAFLVEGPSKQCT